LKKLEKNLNKGEKRNIKKEKKSSFKIQKTE
jgi:hypothetical protein